MLNVQQILTMHCCEASRLTSDSFDRRLTWSERIGMWAHLGICGSCRRARRQLALVQRWMSQWLALDDPVMLPEVRLSQACRQRIKSALREMQ